MPTDSNPNWTKWIVLSIAKYAQDYFGANNIWFQGQLKEKMSPLAKFELRYLGPDIISQTANESELEIILNCQIATQRSAANDIELHLSRVGTAQALLAQCIPVYRYGSNSAIDDGAFLNHLQQRSNVDTTSFGTIDPVSSVERSTVEAKYCIYLES